MINYRLLFVLLLFATAVRPQSSPQKFITDDIINFWNAYDRVSATTDSAEQYRLLQTLYLDKATPGLKSLLEVRRYTPAEYITAIRQYPQFWNSLRANTLQVQEQFTGIETHIANLKSAYPSLQPADIYFSIGVFRTGGTYQGNRVLIGAELTCKSNSLVTSELPSRLQDYYKQYTPIEDIPLLCTHEYIHTQQKPAADNFLCYVMHEGVAEFISCFVNNKSSIIPSFAFAKNNEALVKQKFMEEVFIPRQPEQLAVGKQYQ
jgi:hypothetical protein